MESSSLGGSQWEGSGCPAIFLRDLDIVDELSVNCSSHWVFLFFLYHRCFWTGQKLYGKVLKRYGVDLRKKCIYQNHNLKNTSQRLE